MADVRPILERVWNAFRQASIVDDLLIIEYIAALLVDMRKQPWPFAADLLPQKQQVRYNVDERLISTLLQEAAQEVGRKGKYGTLIPDWSLLFDTHVLFFPSIPRESQAYPTPRHLLRLMIALARIEPEHSVADLVCGSGGTLVHKGNSKPGTRTLGLDISANWIRIAATNAFLHGRTGIQFQQSDTLHANDTSHEGGGVSDQMTEVFDRIVLSPPLNTFVSRDTHATSPSGRGYSDLAFTELLLSKLKPGGRGVTIVSDAFINYKGIIPSFPTKAVGHLKRQFVQERTLKAVITQENGTLVPKEPVHILCLHNGQAIDPEPVWFVQMHYDGYQPHVKRDFTQDPDLSRQKSDIPFVQQIVQKPVPLADFDHHIDPIYIQPYYEGNKALGVVVHSDSALSITYLEQAEPASSAFYLTSNNTIVEITPQALKRHQTNNGIRIVTTNTRDAATRTARKRPHFSFEKAPYPFIALSTDGRLLGVTQDYDQLRTNRYNEYILEPDAYLKPTDDPKQENFVASTPETGFESYSEESVPLSRSTPALTLPTTSDYAAILPRMLNASQYEVWQAITRYSRYFHPAEIRMHTKQQDISSTLALLESLGLIRRVLLRHTQNDTAMLYRRLGQHEITLPSATTKTSTSHTAKD